MNISAIVAQAHMNRCGANSQASSHALDDIVSTARRRIQQASAAASPRSGYWRSCTDRGAPGIDRKENR